VQTSALSSLPAAGTLAGPGQANLTPKIVSPNTTPAISTAAGAHHFRFVGVEITTLRTLFERDEDTVPQLAVERLREMSLAVRVLDEKDFAGADASRLAVACRDLDSRRRG
jgi:hypothetical protein